MILMALMIIELHMIWTPTTHRLLVAVGFAGHFTTAAAAVEFLAVNEA